MITSCCAIVVSLCSPTVTRGVDPASSWRARAPAVTTNSNELESLLRSIILFLLLCTARSFARRALVERPDDGFGFGAHPLQSGPLRGENRLHSIRRRVQLVVD